jgi:two-component system sensor histidine kinase RegB
LTQILIYLRYLAVAGGMLALIVANAMMDLGAARVPLIGTLSLLLLINVAAHAWLRRRQGDAAALIAIQLCVDMLALTVVLHFSGGPGNPFASLYLVPVAVAAATLRVRYAVPIGMLAALLYTALLGKHQHLMGLGGQGFATHVTGMWIGFLISGVILVTVLGRFRAIVQEQRQRLAKARERALRDEALIAVGALAAGTAHELNTPLSTLGMLVDECAASPSDATAEDYALMREQLARCRDHVGALAALARKGALGEAVVEPADAFVSDCLNRWQLLRPGVEVRVAQAAPGVSIKVDQSLPQAMLNLLNNAADANASTGSSDAIVLQAGVQAGRYVLHILDRGPGPKRDQDAASGPTRGTGLGIGLLISNASIERCGGDVRLFAREGGGCVTEVILPVETMA